ncbi:growth arrest-specific protein 2 isoform X1 [Solenopsis invicta]|uniref:growth arrest-specific protein 2 isoform X1 n=1 Tax=Solenopsis invicta TaxID=13686 RepID=UPI00193E9BFE|nr:growth arrest-specific protein 2 isoform X1 [Solenopsis invicta]XP_025991137.2 growth arrest-specific protein 2 isoform X1 [Solenopsis invicta]XP_039315562.1 growth arrest-specific protein 2 isoform X1 [Solenopsis invicta]
MSYANRFPSSQHTRYRSSWGPSSVSVFNRADVPRPSPEEEEFEFYHERLHSAQSRQLIPLQEDLADWINKTINVDYITGDNFFDVLDNGVIVCRLARVIQEKARTAIEAGRAKGPAPVIRGRCWENAARRSFFSRSFFSRDNMENFIQFCRRLGVHENLLFESDDLVLHGQPRNVVLCLLEVARLAARYYSLEPPGLVQLEREIAAEQERDLHCMSDSGISHSSLVSWQFQSPSPTATPRPPQEKIKHSSSASEVTTTDTRWLDPVTGATHESEMRRSVSDNGPTGSDGVPSDTTEDDWSRGSVEDPDEVPSPSSSPSPSPAEPPEHTGPITELDRKVRRATEAVQRLCQCPSNKCSKLKVRKVGEGRYHIAGRNVFIRLLKGRHMMVRVGGGWDTLEHFLARHDPCQVRVLNREGTPPPGSKHDSFLHIRAKYRSSPSEPSLSRRSLA